MSNNVKRVARVACLSVLVETSFDGKVGGQWSMGGGGAGGTQMGTVGVLVVGRSGLQRETWEASFLQQYAALAMPHIYPPLCLCYLSFSLSFFSLFVSCLFFCYLSFSLLFKFFFGGGLVVTIG